MALTLRDREHYTAPPIDSLGMDIDPYENDPARWGSSLATQVEVLRGVVEAARPATLLEVGAYAGDLTRLLLDLSSPWGGRVTAIDPFPQQGLERLQEERPELELIRATSFDALKEIARPDLAVVDGDHNYYTVSEELRLIAEASAGQLPLLLLHDVGWPHGRRDSYFSPEAIPEDFRQPMVEAAGMFPGEPGVFPDGLAYTWAAEREGGSRNGVLTAVEDFVAGHDGTRLAIVPAFFGLAVVWQLDAPWHAQVARVLDPFDRNPLIDRLEQNRVHHLADANVLRRRVARLEERLARQEQLLQELLKSRSFSVAERISRIRHGGDPAISKEAIRRVLSD
jgi:Methyltransferase domain